MRGLAPKEFETSLTKKVDGLLDSTGLNMHEPFIKEAIQKVKTQVCTRRNTKRRRPVDLPGEHAFSGGLFSSQPVRRNKSRRARVYSQGEQEFNDMFSFSSSRHRDQSQLSRTDMYHNKQQELFTGALRPKFDVLLCDRGIHITHIQNGCLFRGEDKLTAIEFCNVIDQISADFLKDLSRMRGDNRWRSTVDFRKVSELCEQILISRNAVQCSVANEFMDEGNYHKWRAHIMVMISFAALMVVAEMNLKELEKSRRHSGEQDPSPLLFIGAALLFFLYLTIRVINGGRQN